MARQARGKLIISAEIVESKTGLGASGNERSTLTHSIEKTTQYTTGTGADQVDRAYSTSGTVDTTGTTTDLVGSLASILDGSTVAPVKLRCLVIENTSSSGNLLVGGSTHPIPLLSGATDKIVVPPKATYAFNFGADGLTLTGASTDEIKLAASAGTVGYKVLVAGTSA